MSNKKLGWLGGFILLLLLFLLPKEVVLVEHPQGQLFIPNDFTLGWIHSVEKEPWYEVYSVQEDELILTETYFKTFGAGTPSEGTYRETTDGYIHFDMNLPTEEINMMVSSNVQVTIQTDSYSIPLYEIVPDYTNVSISVQRVSLWHYLRGEKYD